MSLSNSCKKQKTPAQSKKQSFSSLFFFSCLFFLFFLFFFCKMQVPPVVRCASASVCVCAFRLGRYVLIVKYTLIDLLFGEANDELFFYFLNVT